MKKNEESIKVTPAVYQKIKKMKKDYGMSIKFIVGLAIEKLEVSYGKIATIKSSERTK